MNILLTNKICNRLGELVQNNELDNDDVVQIIEHLGGYLNLTTIADYARENNMSYNGVKKFRTIKRLFNVNFVIDNE